MNETIVTLKKGEGRAFKAGGLWIYDNEIESIHGTFKNGAVVTVQEQNGCPLGRGFINQNSKIRVRMLTRDASQEIDDAFLEMRVRNAWAYRKRTVDTSACRVIFGEADFLPGLVIDKFSDVLVVESLALGIDKMKLQIVDILKKVLLEDGIKIRGVYERSDAKERLKEGMDRKKGFIGDEFDTDVEIVENGVRYIVDVKDGQKTGFFLDQKYNRLAMQRICKDMDVLDCFTHTGSFALNAGIAGAKHVLGVDASELAVALVLFIISAAVVFTLNFRPLYYFDVDHLNITAMSGLPREEILQNYNVLIDYNSIFGTQVLNFPTLAMSESGRIHFEEVKNVFGVFEITLIISGILSLAGIIYRHFKKNPGYLLLSGILTVAIPAALGVLIALNWETVFVLFHKIVFHNNYWIFDAATDPVITILPDTFFMHCALMILTLVVLGSIICLLAYRHAKHKKTHTA